MRQSLDVIWYIFRQRQNRFCCACLHFNTCVLKRAREKIQEVGGTYRGVIEASGLKVPQLFRISEEDSRMINESLIEFESELSKFKLQTEKMSLQLKKTKSIGAFAKLCDIQGKFANNVLLFSQKNILNKLEQEVVQKRSSKEEVEVITEGDE